MNKQEKKLKTVSTSVKEENVEITQVTANGNVVIHPVTKAQNVKYKNSNLNDVLENKIALDGDGGQNFNFIENEVVQEGLVGCFSSDKFNNTEVDLSAGFTYIAKYGKLGNWSRVMNAISSRALLEVMDNGTSGDSRLYFALEDEKMTEGFKMNPSGGIVVATSIDGLFTAYAVNSVTKYLSKTTNITLTKPSGGLYDAVLIYNRVLTPQEIQHNFSVLNNPPSIKELHTTDSAGKTSILNLASSEDFVEMSTGRTLREEYMGVLKTMGKEFTSADGSPIQVPNGIEARIINAEIKGQTVKNEIIKKYGDNGDGFYTRNKTTIQQSNTIIPKSSCNIIPNEKYTIYTLVEKTTLDGIFYINGSNSNTAFNDISLGIPTVGVKRNVATAKASGYGVANALSPYTSANGEITYKCIIIKGDVDLKLTEENIRYLSDGLNSTSAIIANNGQSYSYYAPTIVGKTRLLKAPKGTQNWIEISADETRDTSTYDYKLDSVGGNLGDVPSASDYIDRARKVKVINTKEIILTGNESWSEYGSISPCKSFIITLSDAKPNHSPIMNVLPYKPTYDRSQESSRITDGNGNFIASILATKLATQDVNGFKTYLKALNSAGKPATLRYQLDTPIEVPLTDEELKAYDGHKKVILLNGFNDIYDTFEIKEDGSGLMTKKFMIIDDSLIDKWIISSQGDPSVNRWQLETDFYKLYPAKCTSLSSISNILASTLNAGSFNSAQVKAGIVYAHTNKTIGVSTEKTISSIEQFKEWFRGQLIIYELDIPIVTHIPKELVPTVRTHKTNILEAGGAVKPSSFKVTLPVDKLAEIEARLQALESTTVDVVLNK